MDIGISPQIGVDLILCFLETDALFLTNKLDGLDLVSPGAKPR